VTGEHVQPGTRGEKITLYTLLRTLGLTSLGAPLGAAADVAPITDLITTPPTSQQAANHDSTAIPMELAVASGADRRLRIGTADATVAVWRTVDARATASAE
jgi:hypothetical protein